VKSIKKIIVVSLLMIPLVFLASLYISYPKKKLSPTPITSLRIIDRNGVLLREVLSVEGGRCRWLRLGEISPHLLQATIAAEDKHFYLHPGVDVLAILRACFQNIKAGEVVSGASTITQQLARNMTPLRRNLLLKAYEMWTALRLERALTKEEILTHYLNRICYGNQAYGAEASSCLYFDKPVSDLSLAEAAFLAGLPRSPRELNPYRYFQLAVRRQKEILNRMHRRGSIDDHALERALQENICLVPEKTRFRAPHFCDYILQQIPDEERGRLDTIQTTLDYSLQEKIETVVKKHVDSSSSRGMTNAAALILDNGTGEILAMVGSRDFFDNRHSGQVNGAQSLRQPGSTLKPFTYGLALERGMTAASLLEDAEIHIKTSEGIFRPKNYDHQYHGLIRMRSALACSYNIPAISILQAIGPDLLYQRLKRLGFESLKKSPSFYGVGLTLGNGEVTLLELVQAYSALARGGIFLKGKSILRKIDIHQKKMNSPPHPPGFRVFSSPIAYILTHILSDDDARTPSFGLHSPLSLHFPCAAKTGTSKDFRDNWTIGYTTRYCVGVWVGNFDGKPMHRVSGITGCGPLFKDIMLLLQERAQGIKFKEPEGLVRQIICPLSGKLVTADCPGQMEEIFIRGSGPVEFCDHIHTNQIITGNAGPAPARHRLDLIQISFPVDGDMFKIDPILPKPYQKIRFRANVIDKRVNRLEWWVNNRKIEVKDPPYSFSWQLKPGSYTIKATARAGEKKLESRPVKITVLS